MTSNEARWRTEAVTVSDGATGTKFVFANGDTVTYVNDTLIVDRAHPLVEIVANPRGFQQYGSLVQLDDDATVSVAESSAATGPHCWLRIKHQSGECAAHLGEGQATAIRDRLSAFLEQIPARWGRDGSKPDVDRLARSLRDALTQWITEPKTEPRNPATGMTKAAENAMDAAGDLCEALGAESPF
jgi:hypothetical protein